MTSELRAAIEAWRRAVEASDVDAAAAVLGDEFMLTSEGGAAPQLARSEWLEALPEIETSSLEVDVGDARDFDDVAVVASRATWAAWRISTRVPA